MSPYRLWLRPLIPLAIASIALLAGSTIALGVGFTASPLTKVPDSPKPASCESPPNNPFSTQGTNYHNAEEEPYVDINPVNPLNIIGVAQQDRWSNGGAHGLVTQVSTNGGTSFTATSSPHFSTCFGGTATNHGNYDRSSDPWISFAPNGDAYQTSLSVNGTAVHFSTTAVLVSKSSCVTAGATCNTGSAWSEPTTIIRDDSTNTVFDDKESVTADPNNANFAYVVWDRLISPAPEAPAEAGLHTRAFEGPAWFSRTTNGGTSWEAARSIFDPGEERNTVGNQIVVLPPSAAAPQGILIDGFDLFSFHPNDGGIRGDNALILRSFDQGATWSSPITISHQFDQTDFTPFSHQLVRSGAGLPEIAVDRARGILYAVWEDSRFSGFQVNDIAFSMSTDAGLHWTTPVKINKTPPSPTNCATSSPFSCEAAFTPMVRVAKDGTVGVSYFDFRDATPAESGLTDVFLTHCSSGCTNPNKWTENELPGASFDELDAPFAFGFFVGDYEGITVVGGNEGTGDCSGTDCAAFRPYFVRAEGTGIPAANNPDPTNVYTDRVGP